MTYRNEFTWQVLIVRVVNCLLSTLSSSLIPANLEKGRNNTISNEPHLACVVLGSPPVAILSFVISVGQVRLTQGLCASTALLIVCLTRFCKRRKKQFHFESQVQKSTGEWTTVSWKLIIWLRVTTFQLSPDFKMAVMLKQENSDGQEAHQLSFKFLLLCSFAVEDADDNIVFEEGQGVSDLNKSPLLQNVRTEE